MLPVLMATFKKACSVFVEPHFSQRTTRPDSFSSIVAFTDVTELHSLQL
jgi:hypothetical protein